MSAFATSVQAFARTWGQVSQAPFPAASVCSGHSPSSLFQHERIRSRRWAGLECSGW